MNQKHAEQIAQLLNSQNKLVLRYDAAKVLSYQDTYLYEVADGGDVIACLEVKKVQWYQFEIDHVSVAPAYVRQGFARRLLARAENEATKKGGRILQCTIRECNIKSQKLFAGFGFVQSVRFHYPNSGNNVWVWQKSLSPAI